MKIILLLILTVLSFRVFSEEQTKNFLEIPKGSAKLGLLLQNWLIYDEKNTTDRSNYRIRRAEIKLSGSIDKDYNWVVMIDPAKSLKAGSVVASNDNKVLQDFILNYIISDELEFSVGQFKIANAAEGLISSSALLLPERSAVGRTYGDKRDPSIRLTWKQDKLKVYSTFSHGNKANTDDSNSEKDLYTRGEYSPFKGMNIGAFFGMVDTYLHKNKWGVNLYWDNELNSFHTEYANESTSSTSGVKRSHGYVLDFAHSFSKEIQSALRYESLSFVRSTDIDSSATTVGLNYFLKDSNSKIQFATVFLNNMTATNGSYDVSSTKVSSSELYLLSFQMGI